MITVRPYTDKDYAEVASWWVAVKQKAPLPTLMPADSTFIAEINGVPAVCVTLYLMNTPEFAHLENLIGSPKADPRVREWAVEKLITHVEGLAKQAGYKRTLALSATHRLKRRYKDLGYRKTLTNITVYVKEL